jgi:uncharacterized protein with PIN domain
MFFMSTSPYPCFACDAMLGGLARWLRAAGYDASWRVDIDDGDLIRQSQSEGRIVLSSDTDISLYTVIRDWVVPSLFIPRNQSPLQQLAHVLEKLALPLREPRCMDCGGSLIEVRKEQVRERVPARTFAWLDQFWECCGCSKIFWHGTHWQRIQERLTEATER